MNRLFLALLCVSILTYGAFEARRLFAGPSITIESPTNGGKTFSTTVTVSGTAQNIAFLTIDDTPAYTDESGHFSLTFAPPPGYSVLVVAASDRFGRRTKASVAFTAETYCPA